jgi:peroxiredoxin
MNIIESIVVQDFNQSQVDLLKKYNNKAILILIYNNQCLGCTGRAIPLAYNFQKEYENLQVIGIHANFNSSLVTEEDIKSIFTIDELPFPIYIDKDHKVYDQFNAEGTPQWLLITPKQELYRTIFGSQSGAQNRLSYALEQLCKD